MATVVDDANKAGELLDAMIEKQSEFLSYLN